MIRTEAVQMTLVKGLAYKQKLSAGGAGITIITLDEKAVFTINKRDGSCTPYGKVKEDIFTSSVINEALELTRGLSYKNLGSISKIYADFHFDELTAEDETEEEKVAIDIVNSVDYKEFISQYTDKNDKFSYQLMNRELIKFASKSSVVKTMIEDKMDVDLIVRYIVKSKAADLAHNKGMEEKTLTVFIDTFDSMNTRSAFKELKAYLRGEIGKSKNN